MANGNGDSNIPVWIGLALTAVGMAAGVAYSQSGTDAEVRAHAAQLLRNQPIIDGIDVTNNRLTAVEVKLEAVVTTMEAGQAESRKNQNEVLNAIRALE